MYIPQWVNFYLSYCKLSVTSLEIIDFSAIDIVGGKGKRFILQGMLTQRFLKKIYFPSWRRKICYLLILVKSNSDLYILY